MVQNDSIFKDPLYQSWCKI